MTALPKTSATIVALCAALSTFGANPQLPLLNDPVDVSGDFRDFSNFYYLADRLADFDPATHAGKIFYQRSQDSVRHAFDNDLAVINSTKPNEFPEYEYAANPTLPFSIAFVSPKTFRIRLFSGFAQVIVQSTGQPGEITLTAKSPGVTDGVLKIQALPAPHRPAVAAN
jgi:alpha-D-xyloside xylohydrolase